MAGDVVAVLDAAGIGRAHVLGASLGGMAAQELAIRHPERGRRPGPGLHDTGLAVRLPDARGLGVAARRDRPSAGRGGTPPPHGERPGRRPGPAGTRAPPAGGAGFAAPDSAVLSAQAVAGSRYAGRLPARIRARTLVLHGGADAVVDPRNGRLLAARIPGARLVTFPELGHLLFWEDPDGFAAAVASFLLGRRPGS